MQLMFASGYSHRDSDLPDAISDLAFLSEKTKHNILGGAAAPGFKLPAPNEKQKKTASNMAITLPSD